MNTIKLTYSSLTIIVLMMLISCEKMIEVDDPINQISTEQVFSSVSTANSALDNLYMEMQANSMSSGGQRGLGALLGAYTDDLDAYFQPSSIDNLNIYNNQILPTNSIVLSVWNNAYKQIYAANAIVYGIENSNSISDSDKKRIKGEALLIRTIIYYQLQRLFGDIPYTETTDYEVNRKLSRMPSADLYIKLQETISIAVSLLEDNYRNAERVYLNKKSAQLVQANIYLTMGKHQEAELVCKNIIASPLYVVQEDLTKVFKKNSTNILWQLKPLNANQSVPETGVFYFSAPPPNSYALSGSLMNLFESTDLRKQNWTVPLQAGNVTFYRNDKYKNFLTNADEYSVVMRLEEVYFILAEALAQQDKIIEAATFVNTIRTRSGVLGISGSLSKPEFLIELLTEKRREFFAEQGLRFFDLKRNNQLLLLAATKPNWQQFHMIFPLPQNELTLNNNLNPQNNGY